MPELSLDQSIDIGAASIYTLLYIVGIPVFLLMRNREPIKSRVWLISVLQMTAAWVDLILRAISEGITTCPVDTWRGMWLLPLWVFPYFGRVFVLWYRFNLQNVLLLRQIDTVKGRTIIWIQAHPWITSIRAQLAWFAFLFVLSTAIFFGVYYGQMDQMGPDCNVPSSFTVNIVQGAMALLLLLVCVIVLWGVNDAYLLKYEFVYLFVTGLPVFIIWAISSQVGWDGFAGNGFWVDIIEILFILGTIYFPLLGTKLFTKLLLRRLRKSSRHGSSGVDMQTGTSLNALYDDVNFIIDDEVLLHKLQQYMIQSWTIENLLFIQKSQEYRRLPAADRGPVAKIILSEYIRDGLCLLSFFLWSRSPDVLA